MWYGGMSFLHEELIHWVMNKEDIRARYFPAAGFFVLHPLQTKKKGVMTVEWMMYRRKDGVDVVTSKRFTMWVFDVDTVWVTDESTNRTAMVTDCFMLRLAVFGAGKNEFLIDPYPASVVG